MNDTTSALDKFGLYFDHPADLASQNGPASQSRYCFASETESRHMRCVIFSSDSTVDDSASYEKTALDAGGWFYHKTETITVGSGGTEYRLTGYVQIDSEKLFVKANAAENAGFNNAEWVLPIIKTVRVVEEG